MFLVTLAEYGSLVLFTSAFAYIIKRNYDPEITIRFSEPIALYLFPTNNGVISGITVARILTVAFTGAIGGAIGGLVHGATIYILLGTHETCKKQ